MRGRGNVRLGTVRSICLAITLRRNRQSHEKGPGGPDEGARRRITTIAAAKRDFIGRNDLLILRNTRPASLSLFLTGIPTSISRHIADPGIFTRRYFRLDVLRGNRHEA